MSRPAPDETGARLCAWCLATIPGGAAYRTRLTITADAEVVLDLDAPPDERDLADALLAVEARSAEDLMADVHRERELLLCRRCADRAWASVPAGRPVS